MEDVVLRYKSWRYKNTAFFVAGLVLFFIFADTPFVSSLVHGVGGMGSLGMFLTGIFFVSTFTIAPASVVLFYFADNYPIWEVALVAGLGGVLGDYIMFKFLKHGVFEELKPVFAKLGGSHFSRLHSTPYFAWLAPVVGAIIIASPFPDEAGIGLMGISKLKTWQFVLLSLALDTLGIFAILTIAKAI